MTDTVHRIKIHKKIGVKQWERFEELADEKDDLWKIFWAISNDKGIVKKEKICAIQYFNKFVLPSLERPMLEWAEEKNLTTNDIEIILSLYVNLIPKEECENCDCTERFLEKLKESR